MTPDTSPRPVSDEEAERWDHTSFERQNWPRRLLVSIIRDLLNDRRWTEERDAALLRRAEEALAALLDVYYAPGTERSRLTLGEARAVLAELRERLK